MKKDNWFATSGVCAISIGIFFTAIGSQASRASSDSPQQTIGNCPTNATNYRGSGRTIRCTCTGGAARSGTVWGTDIYTDDSKICRAAVHAGIINQDGGEVKLTMSGGRSSYSASSRNDVSTKSFGKWHGSYQFSRRSSSSSSAGNSSEKQIVSVSNPAACGFTDSSTLRLNSRHRVDRLEIWYNWASSESSTAYQLLGSQGQVIRRGTFKRASCDPYQKSWCVGRDRPGLTLESGTYQIRVPRSRICQNSGSKGRGFVQAWGISVGGSSGSQNVKDCPSNATAFRGSGRTVTCRCTDSATTSGSVWGTGVYTDDSKICRAAVHAGKIGSRGGVVTFTTLSGQSSYSASMRNGVSTASFGSWSGSYRF